MKNILFTLFFISLSNSLLSQNSKKIIYLNTDNIEITKKQYNTAHKKTTFNVETENDTVIIKKLYSRKNFVKLDSIYLNQIKGFLTKVSGAEFDKNKNTIIHLYRENNNIRKDIKYKKYWNYIKKHSNKYQSFLIGSKESGIKQDIKHHIYLDEKDFLNYLFFENSIFEINHLFIKPNGETFIFFGVDDILMVLDWSV